MAEYGIQSATQDTGTEGQALMSIKTLDLKVDDNGSLKAVIGSAKRFQRRALRDIERSCNDFAYEFRDEVRSRAEGRPGPRRITSNYWQSIEVVSVSGGLFKASFQKSVVSYHPAAARLEMGYVGIDAAGRHYNQPPFPHWRPAIEHVGPKWVNSFSDLVPRWWRP